MANTRGGLGRITAMAVGLAVLLLLVAAGEARAGLYSVAQCGWYVGADATWGDTTGGAKFRPEAACTGSAADPRARSLGREGQGTVSGGRYAAWRWNATGGTGIVQVRGSWWHGLHDGFEHRLGGVDFGNNFAPFANTAATDLTPREFAVGFPIPVAAFEDRLLCTRAAAGWCGLDPGSWSALRGLTLTVIDNYVPDVGIGGSVIDGGWRRGDQGVVIWAADLGSGLTVAESFVDGTRVGLSDLGCAKAAIGGEWRATAMRPCATEITTAQSFASTAFADGPHAAMACAIDFSGNRRCTPNHPFLVDNNPPTQVAEAAVVGGEGWRRSPEFGVAWANPWQGAASPIAGVVWRLTGAQGFDSGVQFTSGRDRRSLSALRLPAAGLYILRLWLRDEAGNESPASAVSVPLRFDDVAPAGAFLGEARPEAPLVATVADAHSGPGTGQILYREAASDRWLELPTKLVRAEGEASGRAELRAPLSVPLGPGTYLFRAEFTDAAGNPGTTTLRADGTRMELRVGAAAARATAAGRKTRIFARLEQPERSGRRRGSTLTVAFGAAARLRGRLLDARGTGVAAREIRILARPSRGALGGAEVLTARTGERGGFAVPLSPGPSRRLTITFAGGDGLDPARRTPLNLRVRTGLTLRATPRSLRTGGSVRLRGRVASRDAAMPRRGKVVVIQYFEQATRRWRPILVTRSDHAGRFRARYRFRYVSGAASVRLRAMAPAEEGWAYAPGASRSLTVEVRGR